MQVTLPIISNYTTIIYLLIETSFNYYYVILVTKLNGTTEREREREGGRKSGKSEVSDD